MVGKIWVCEICQEEYDTEKDALECEAQGVTPAIRPVGTVLVLPTRNGYVKCTITKIVKGYVDDEEVYRPTHVHGYLLNRTIQLDGHLSMKGNRFFPLVDTDITGMIKYPNEFSFIKRKNDLS